MTTERKPDQMIWWILFALIVLGIIGALIWQHQQRQEDQDRYRQEEIDRPGIHELQRDLGR